MFLGAARPCSRRAFAAAVAVAALACSAAAYGQASAVSVYESIAPAVVFVQTGRGGGSGLLLESNNILTAAHVVYPYETARIVFPNGTERIGVPVIGWDLQADIAVLGPVPRVAAPPKFDLASGLPIGSDVFSIGYPGETESFPQPALSRGVLSRYRFWSDPGITYLQSDAAADPGQSGGVLASADGAVLGMTVFGNYNGADFGLTISARDVLPRVEALLAGDDPAGLGDRRWPHAPEVGPLSTTLHTYWSEQAFVIDAQPGDEVTFEAHGTHDIALRIIDSHHFTVAQADETELNRESITATLDGTGPFVLEVSHFSRGAVHVTVEGDAGLTRLVDPDDRTVLQVPARHTGSIDYPGDVDYFRLPLHARQAVRIHVDSSQIDSVVTVDRGYGTFAIDDDSGGGVFGGNAELLYRALQEHIHYVVIYDANGTRMGGYTLTIEPEEG